MSSSATIKLARSVPLAEWETFCAEQHIRYSPNTVGQNVYYCGQVEITFGPQNGSLERDPQRDLPLWSPARPPTTGNVIEVSTFFLGPEIRQVARLALAIRDRWNGQLRADPEIEAQIGGLVTGV